MNKRLQALLALLLLLVVRWWDPFPTTGGEPSMVSAAVERPALVRHEVAVVARESVPTVRGSVGASARAMQPEHRNAFEVRGAAAPADTAAALPPSPRVRRVVLAAAFERPAEVLPPSEPVQVPPPFQVIGTWNDGQSPGVFVALPSGTALARAGQTLLADYKVERINQQELVLKQLSNQREWTLPIPQPINRSR